MTPAMKLGRPAPSPTHREVSMNRLRAQSSDQQLQLLRAGTPHRRDALRQTAPQIALRSVDRRTKKMPFRMRWSPTRGTATPV
jgi:hypothetical protein